MTTEHEFICLLVETLNTSIRTQLELAAAIIDADDILTSISQHHGLPRHNTAALYLDRLRKRCICCRFDDEFDLMWYGRMCRKCGCPIHHANVDVMQFNVAGCSYRQAAIGSLTVGHPCLLVREQSNPVDKYAIAVMTADDRQIGYLPQVISSDTSKLMDMGCIVAAIVHSLGTTETGIQTVVLSVYTWLTSITYKHS